MQIRVPGNLKGRMQHLINIKISGTTWRTSERHPTWEKTLYTCKRRLVLPDLWFPTGFCWRGIRSYRNWMHTGKSLGDWWLPWNIWMPQLSKKWQATYGEISNAWGGLRCQIRSLSVTMTVITSCWTAEERAAYIEVSPYRRNVRVGIRRNRQTLRMTASSSTG